eukprot:TRINITY_DN40395_c0_g1_i1.p1 TRINITY_DN40395_c0_g1~~TRINITY_DN40395_c0_g1_i1.p1  ORF type:complete len:362 (-),score=53.43 TRINITY_DN40395_c0_g1_i1:60-1145(-)
MAFVGAWRSNSRGNARRARNSCVSSGAVRYLQDCQPPSAPRSCRPCGRQGDCRTAPREWTVSPAADAPMLDAAKPRRTQQVPALATSADRFAAAPDRPSSRPATARVSRSGENAFAAGAAAPAVAAKELLALPDVVLLRSLLRDKARQSSNHKVQRFFRFLGRERPNVVTRAELSIGLRNFGIPPDLTERAVEALLGRGRGNEDGLELSVALAVLGPSLRPEATKAALASCRLVPAEGAERVATAMAETSAQDWTPCSQYFQGAARQWRCREVPGDVWESMPAAGTLGSSFFSTPRTHARQLHPLAVPSEGFRGKASRTPACAAFDHSGGVSFDLCRVGGQSVADSIAHEGNDARADAALL